MGLLGQRSDDEEERGDVSIAGLEHLGGDDETVYELDDWGDRGRALLQERLATLGVPHRWEDASSLVIAATDEAWVERVMDQVEDDLSLALDPDVPQVAYDLTSWDALGRERLFASLEDEAVPYGIDGEELFVHEIDEQRVDELIDVIVRPEGAADVDGDDDAPGGGPEAMGELFVAADRLAHDPVDAEGTLGLIAAVRAAGPTPYGMDKVWWDGVLSRADALVELRGADEPDDDAVGLAATELRDALRPYV